MSTLQHTALNQRIVIKNINSHITCGLCSGYLIDATTLIECLHVFCRACILRHFENKLRCPTCSLVYKKKSYPYFRSDTIIQALVYKLVPGLYNKEVQRREDFYRSTGARAGSSCSEDSVLGDLNEEQEEWQIPSPHGENYQFLSPDDAISLSLEYYQPVLDKSLPGDESPPVISDQNLSVSEQTVHNCDNNCNCVNTNNNLCDGTVGDGDDIKSHDIKSAETDSGKVCDQQQDKKKCDRRYLRCPAAVTMSLLQKFLRMKHALKTEHRVDIIHAGEVLPTYFTLMDVAYTFKWQRLKPLRFFYRIFTPIKIQPIKIKRATLGTHVQLQVVQVDNHQSIEIKPESPSDTAEMDEDKNKETLMTNLRLKSVAKPPQIFTSRLNRTEEVSKGRQQKDEEAQCVYEYEEPDKEEIRAFAEKRDLEWALQKQLDEAKQRYRIIKKRKKSKHKGNLLYKKRKLHAEITSNESLQSEECLKLKVKLTQPNGYKHKHHRSSQSHEHVSDALQRELSSKEKLLQMRQVRHKHVVKAEISDAPPPLELFEKPPQTPPSTIEEDKIEPAPKLEPVSLNKTLRSDFTIKTSATKEVCLQKLPTVQLERNPQTEQHAQQTFLKTFQSYTEKLAHRNGLPQSPPFNYEKASVNNAQVPKSLEKKIASLQQQCTTVEAKPVKQENAVKSAPEIIITKEKQLVISSQFSSGFTVSKIEAGMKRNSTEIDHQKIQEKRPSLEITLINPSAPDDGKFQTKRPLPATIPLDKIRRSINRMSGVSIVPKLSQVTDSTKALDLSKPNKSPETSPKTTEALPAKLLNGLALMPSTTQTTDKNIQLSNLQMLSKVASEHPSINNKRPQLPNLNTLKIPNPSANLKANLAKLPKLNEISKTQFRLPNPQVRNMRPNQNQSIRNIPNPSLLVRQQNQNRLNSLTGLIPLTPESKQICTTESSKDEKVKSDDKTVDNQNPLTVASI